MRFSHLRITTLKRSPSCFASSISRPPLAARCGLGLLALTLLTGCGTLPSAAPLATVAPSSRGLVAQQPPPPPWETPVTPAELLEPNAGAMGRLYSQEPLRLRQELSAVCQGMPAAAAPRVLRSLVADLYFSGVAPTVATEALVLGKCGTPPEVVTEMVARGGEAQAALIVERAQLLQGSGATRPLTAAVQAGLARLAHLQQQAEDNTAAAKSLPTYGMVYFPAAGDFSKVDTAIALNRLYEDAIPGYGLYTFVLVGKLESKATPSATTRAQELLRVIETYITADAQHADPNLETPAFLIPIYPEKVGQPLIEQVAFDLAESMRNHLSATLRRNGQTQLATQIEHNSGPFLVSSLEPRLTPTDPAAPHLITDLSMIGAEHLYGVIDAYDRPLATSGTAQLDNLAAIQERLLALPIKVPTTTGKKAQGKSNWVSLLGALKSNQTATHRREALYIEPFSEFHFITQPDFIRAI
ncbi:hypothetical protein [Chromatium okenii]|uniref:hypothetical protein n=1 Tax=Chromatium okenii TaxID=61644 RepID=UPI001A91611B|nr:hypothetical protein [Chromatium okenii]